MHLYHKEDGEDIFKKQVRWNIKFLRNYKSNSVDLI